MQPSYLCSYTLLPSFHDIFLSRFTLTVFFYRQNFLLSHLPPFHPRSFRSLYIKISIIQPIFETITLHRLLNFFIPEYKWANDRFRSLEFPLDIYYRINRYKKKKKDRILSALDIYRFRIPFSGNSMSEINEAIERIRNNPNSSATCAVRDKERILSH